MSETEAAAAAPAAPAQNQKMKFNLRVKIGVDGGPGVGITTKTVPYTIEAETLQDALNQGLQLYVEKYGREPNRFAQFSFSLALDTGEKKPDAE